MKEYNKYKDSNIESIGNIPFDWSATKLKFISNVYNGNSLNDDLKEKYESDDLNNIPYISTKDVEPESGKINLMNGMRIPRNEGNLKIAPSGSFVLCIEGGSAGKKIGYLTEDVYFVNKLACFDYNNKFLYYYALSDNFKNQFFNSLSGLIGGVSISTIRNFYTTFPSLTEQNKIAIFLDYKTNLIDSTIEKKKKLIELLKEKRQAIINESVTKGLNQNAPMKDSGVEWLGKIPAHWKVKKLKHIKSNKPNAFVDGPFGSNLKTEHYIENGDVYVIESGFITSGKFIFKRDFKTISESHFETINRSECNENDIILAKIGANYGMSAILPKLDKKSVVSGNSLKLSVDAINNDLNFIHLFLLFLKQSGSFELIVNESAQPALSLGALNNISISIPEKDEQIKIREFIEKNNSIIDTAIDIIDTAIEKLQEYRQSLISEAVTGKIDIRDWQPPKNT